MDEWTERGQGRLATARAHHNDALDAMARSDYTRAHRLLSDAHRLRASVVPPHHPLCLATMDLLANVTIRLGQRLEGRKLLLELYNLQVDRLGRYHTDVESTAQRIVTLCQQIGDQATADKFAEEVWHVRTAPRGTAVAAELDRLLAALPLPAHLRNKVASAPGAVGEGTGDHLRPASTHGALHVQTALDERLAANTLHGGLPGASQPGHLASRLLGIDSNAGTSPSTSRDPLLDQLLHRAGPSPADVLLATGSPPPTSSPKPLAETSASPTLYGGSNHETVADPVPPRPSEYPLAPTDPVPRKNPFDAPNDEL